MNVYGAWIRKEAIVAYLKLSQYLAGKLRKTSVKIAVRMAEIRTGCISNTSIVL
jgi:hypothetical protein